MNVFKEAIDLDDVYLNDTEKYNSNNHGNRPSDYFSFIDSCNTCKWVDMFRNDYNVIKIASVKHLMW